MGMGFIVPSTMATRLHQHLLWAESAGKQGIYGASLQCFEPSIYRGSGARPLPFMVLVVSQQEREIGGVENYR